MAGKNTNHRDGSWTVELYIPIKAHGGPITKFVFKPLEVEQIVRWGNGEITSSMALMAEMAGVPEPLLRKVLAPDFKRIMLAFLTMVEDTPIRSDVEQGRKPMASVLPEAEPEASVIANMNDPIDPRFPYVPGPVKRMSDPIDDGDTGISVKPPDAIRAVK